MNYKIKLKTDKDLTCLNGIPEGDREQVQKIIEVIIAEVVQDD